MLRAPDDWICLHSLGLARHDTKRRGEIDFLLIVPAGVFVLEVKGGRVRRDQGIWIFTDRYDRSNSKAEGPFDQAAGAMFALEREIRERFAGKQLANILLGHGVVFPDIEFDSVGCDSDPALVYDARDCGHPFLKYLDRLTRFTRERQTRRRYGLSKEEISELAAFLRGDFDLIPSVHSLLDDTREQLAELTREQRAALDATADTDRVLIEGPAGSGKTLLALEAARRDARQGRRVLFLCYNRMLAVLAQVYAGSVLARTAHSHFRSLIQLSSLDSEFRDLASRCDDRETFQVLYPKYAAMAAMESVDTPYDTLVVDEAQDLMSHRNLEAMTEIVRGGLYEGGRWRLFLDSNNQACLYGRLESSALERIRALAPTRLLTVNCRNTRPIALQTNVVANPEWKAEARIDGPPVDFLSYSTDRGPLGKLEKVVADLRRDGVSPGRVSVLFAHSLDREQERMLSSLGIEKLREQDVTLLGTDRLSCLSWAVVSGFKGLENDVIVLVGVENIEDDWWRAVTYVGMSRARGRLYVISHSECEPVRLHRLRQ